MTPLDEATKLRLWRASLVLAGLAVAWAVRKADWGVVWRNLPFLLRSLGTSILLTILALAIGLVAGVFLALLRLYGRHGLRQLAVGYIELVRAVPQLMGIFWVLYTGPALTGHAVAGWNAAVIALSMIASAYLAEVVRAGILAVPRLQLESAHASGLTRAQAMRHIVLPQALHAMVPALIAHFIMLFKSTSLVFVVGVIDFFRSIIILNNRDFAPGALYMAMAIGYFVCCYALSWLMRRIEPRYALTGFSNPYPAGDRA